MSLEGQRLGMALAEANRGLAIARIAHATFTCEVFANDLPTLGTAAWTACQRYFGDQPFEIESLDGEEVPAPRVRVGETFETEAIEPSSYRALVRARAV